MLLLILLATCPSLTRSTVRRLPPWDYNAFQARQDCLTVAVNNTRWVHTALPLGPAPATGWPVLIKFEVCGWLHVDGYLFECG